MKSPKKPRSRTRERAWTLFFMLAVTLGFGSVVSWLHVSTQDRVRENEKLFLRRALRAAAGLPKLPDSELPAWVAAAVTPVTNMATAYYNVRTSDDAAVPPVSVFERAGAGLWGQIRAAVGISASPEGPRLTGVAVLEQGETPGLGARIDEPWFAEQLRGKHGILKLVPEDTRSEKPDEIDGITGATITSAAVRDILNRVLSEDAAAISPTERSAPDGQDERR
jgi:Na+-transporting NADH:ubiquinone oxidoreductase subunit C